MKKVIIILTIIITILSLNKHETIIKQDESIRFRIIASSNNKEDQALKKKIINNLSKEIESIETNKTIDDTRNNIKKTLPKFNQIVSNTIKQNKRNNSFNINYGNNYFPEKTYKNTVYKEGYYESLVITLGEGKGDNFWCILFPPLCITDNTEKKEYKSFIKEIIKKYF